MSELQSYGSSSEYAVEEIVEMQPNDHEIFAFGTDHQERVRLRIHVCVESGEEWTGVFGPGYDSPEVSSAIVHMPDNRTLCVVLEGRGFLIDVRQPSDYETLRIYPVTHISVADDCRVVVMADFTHIAGFGTTGLMWVTQRISWDGFQELEVHEDVLTGNAWDAIESRYRSFAIHIPSGECSGCLAVPEST